MTAFRNNTRNVKPGIVKTLGVTGGIGSGKTAVCRILEDQGARVFYADVEAKRILGSDPEAQAEIRDAFGAESFRPSGTLNRAYLADRVFSDEKQLERLNNIVHPRVFDAFEEEKEKAAENGVELLVHEAALIFESGADRHLDAVAVVDAPEETRIARVRRRDQVSEEQVRERIQHQLPPHELRRRADFIIENTGTLDDLREQVEHVYHSLLQEA